MSISRTQGIIDRLAGAEKYTDAKWLLETGVLTNYTESVVDAKMRANMEFQGGAGLTPKVERITVGPTCKWCEKLAGVYYYPDVPADVWRRHDNCNCIIRYTAATGRVDVRGGYKKAWELQETTNPEELAERRTTGLESQAERSARAETLAANDYQSMQDARNGIHTIDGARLVRVQAGRPESIVEAIQKGIEQSADGILIYVDRAMTMQEMEDLKIMVGAELRGVEHFIVNIWGAGIDGVQTLLEI